MKENLPEKVPLPPIPEAVKARWKLNVQGVVVESAQPHMTVRDAIKQAGFNPETPWIIVLKITGEPKREVDLSFTIDLTHAGIEKLRLTPRHINNGEMMAPQRLDFPLLPDDEAHLGRLGLRWETINDGGRRWLLIRNLPLPVGYQATTADIAVEVPVSYPTAQLDMFYCRPALALTSGAVIRRHKLRKRSAASPISGGRGTVTGIPPATRW